MKLEVNQLTKKYGRYKALDDISFTINNGKVMGLLGPNGSGKTTLIKIIANLIKTYRGSVLIDGEAPSPITKAFVSYLPDRNSLDESMKVQDAFKIFEDFYPDYDPVKADSLLEQMEIKPQQKIGTLSKGMAEKLQLALVLSRNAGLYILDEPIAGVDLLTRKQILDMIINNISEDSTMLITTHLVSDMEKLFDEVIFIDEGKIITSGNCEELIEKYHCSITELYEKIYGGLNHGQID
ncbi:MAG: ABC transporter ATP-binding protein [Tissierellia bacterium]|nr:ABC transporter ATP-binding protein [Tissierellia bacterium]